MLSLPFRQVSNLKNIYFFLPIESLIGIHNIIKKMVGFIKERKKKRERYAAIYKLYARVCLFLRFKSIFLKINFYLFFYFKLIFFYIFISF
jgi:hypothetical protein